jgi:hypothetical protein
MTRHKGDGRGYSSMSDGNPREPSRSQRRGDTRDNLEFDSRRMDDFTFLGQPTEDDGITSFKSDDVFP